MSHHDSIQHRIPKVVSLAPPRLLASPMDAAQPQLLVAGQGCVTFTLSPKATKASLRFKTKQKAGQELILTLTDKNASFSYKETADSRPKKLQALPKTIVYPKVADGYTRSIDSNPKCVYWISIDSINKVVSYGKGERRKSCVLLACTYDEVHTVFTKKNKKDRYVFIRDLQYIEAGEKVNLSHVWKDPVIYNPPAKVVATDQFTMTDATQNTLATPTSLSDECQILYGNISGSDFTLNTADFPDFEQAIEYSIRTKGCLGYRIIEHKLANNTFSKDTAANHSDPKDDYKEVYLRITLGAAQGESPGIPYVMEIWPPGCGSPIHHHGYTHAIIKVLRGAIDVDIYRMLPGKGDPTAPLESVTFEEDDVTYIMPQANQFHRLRNNKDNAATCITIQCYAYAQDDDVHYPNFDYIEDGKLGHFDPISDYDFVQFKKEIKEEWEEYLRTRFWSTWKPKKKAKRKSKK